LLIVVNAASGTRANVCSVTSQGSAQGRFQRAIERDQVLQAEIAARELERPVTRALLRPRRFAEVRAGRRALAGAPRARGGHVRLAEVQLAAAALGCLRGTRRERAEKTLLRLL